MTPLLRPCQDYLTTSLWGGFRVGNLSFSLVGGVGGGAVNRPRRNRKGRNHNKVLSIMATNHKRRKLSLLNFGDIKWVSRVLPYEGPAVRLSIFSIFSLLSNIRAKSHG